MAGSAARGPQKIPQINVGQPWRATVILGMAHVAAPAPHIAWPAVGGIDHAVVLDALRSL